MSPSGKKLTDEETRDFYLNKDKPCKACKEYNNHE